MAQILLVSSLLRSIDYGRWKQWAQLVLYDRLTSNDDEAVLGHFLCMKLEELRALELAPSEQWLAIENWILPGGPFYIEFGMPFLPELLPSCPRLAARLHRQYISEKTFTLKPWALGRSPSMALVKAIASQYPSATEVYELG